MLRTSCGLSVAQALDVVPAWEVDMLLDVHVAARAAAGGEPPDASVDDGPVRDPDEVPAWVAGLPAN